MQNVHNGMTEDGEVPVHYVPRTIVRRPRLNVSGTPEFVAKLEEFVDALQNMINEHYKEKLSTLEPKIVTVENGIKNVRIVTAYPDNGNRSVHCFINKANGDILKAAGWKAPAKHARGNIYKSLLGGVNEYGANYL